MSRFQNGWLRLNRKAVFEDIGQNPMCLAIWIWLLAMATIRPSKIRWRGQMRIIPAGTIVTGRRELSEIMGVSESTVLRHLKYLSTSDRIQTESGQDGTIVTICKWEEYQNSHSDGEQRVNKEWTEDDTASETVNDTEPDTLIEQVTTNKEQNTTCSDFCPPQKVPAEPFRLCDELSALDPKGDLKNLLAPLGVSLALQMAWLKAFDDHEWLVAEFFKAVAWIEANPRKRPKKFSKFMGGWLMRGWERHRKGLQSLPSQPTDFTKLFDEVGQ